MSRMAIVASVAVDYINGLKRCGGSAIYSPLSLYLAKLDFDLFYLASKGYPFSFPFHGKRLNADKDFIFEIIYHGDRGF